MRFYKIAFIAVISLLLTGSLQAAVDVTLTADEWIGIDYGDDKGGNIVITNNTDAQIRIDGVRITIPGASYPAQGISPI